MTTTATELPAVVIMGVGICYASVCVLDGTDDDDIVREVNQQNPTGISSRWQLSADETFADGLTNPCPCNEIPGRSHRLLEC